MRRWRDDSLAVKLIEETNESLLARAESRGMRNVKWYEKQMNTLFPSIIYNPATRIFVPRDARNSMLDWVNQLKDKKTFVSHF